MPAATLAYALWQEDYPGAWQFAGSFTLTLAATEVLKRSTRVTRPDQSNDQSFPSGHAARAFASATYLHRRYGFEQAWPSYLLAGYVGYTRVEANRHRWTDVLGAAAVAGVSSWWLVDPSNRQRPALSLLLGHKELIVQLDIALP
ncbi:phosphatase PAP2 family protein [Roseateles oligotrophus]|uniref:Phosphatase PAP2 family protein n=1 Tax=Roseateles oligotrophus TaxID=1769250 RepID=A0ABT2YN41_9BURK|nr:phosphatase PAP2 family protein [Roseateles oligotrophus]MCV2371305.1 phosphatase PAP2 family protein [Roseateles oligotrophus]